VRTSRFQELRDRAAAAVDRVFAEPVRLSPMKAGKSDPDRAQHIFEAVLRTDVGDETSPTGSTASGSQEWRSKLIAGKAELHINRASYQGPSIEQQDKIRAMSRPGEPSFVVLYVDDRSHARLVLHLGEAR